MEVKESDRLFTSLIHTIKERQTEVNAEIKEEQKAVERRAEELISELQQEITELQRRNTEMEELKNTEDHLHLLQVNIKLGLWVRLMTVETFLALASLNYIKKKNLIFICRKYWMCVKGIHLVFVILLSKNTKF